MTVQSIRDAIADINSYAVVFDNPSFDNSIIGISVDGEVVYSLSKMIEELSNDDNISLDDAYEFIDYNTIRLLPYIGQYRPVIVDDSLSGTIQMG